MNRKNTAHKRTSRKPFHHDIHRRILRSPVHFSIAGVILLVIIGIVFYTQKATRAQNAENFQSIMAKGRVKSSASDRVLVKFKSTISSLKKEEIYKKHNTNLKSTIRGAKVESLSVPTGSTPESFVTKLKNEEKDNILFAETDDLITPEVIPNDPYYSLQWHLPKISVTDAWNRTIAAGVTVGICDTGVDGSHPDLAGALLTSLGYNTADNTTNWSPVHWHGTSTAGTTAAVTNEGYGAAGVAWGAKIIPVRISNFTDGSAYVSDAADCITYSADNGASAINLSYLMAGYSTIDAAAAYAEIKNAVTVVAAGNNAINPGWPDFGTFLAVSATDQNDALAGFSNYGTYVDIAAPGVSVLAPYPGGWAYVSGTSFSAPIVTGALAMIYAAQADLGASEAKTILLQSADDLGTPGEDLQYGAGRVNIKNAIDDVLGALPTPTPTAAPLPTATPTKTPTPTPSPTPGAGSTFPVVSVSYPISNSLVKRNSGITIEATATGADGIEYVEFSVNNKILCQDTESPYSCFWRIPGRPGAYYTIKAHAKDNLGNVGSAVVLVTSIK